MHNIVVKYYVTALYCMIGTYYTSMCGVVTVLSNRSLMFLIMYIIDLGIIIIIYNALLFSLCCEITLLQ